MCQVKAPVAATCAVFIRLSRGQDRQSNPRARCSSGPRPHLRRRRPAGGVASAPQVVAMRCRCTLGRLLVVNCGAEPSAAAHLR